MLAQNRMLGPFPSSQLSAAPRKLGLSWAKLHLRQGPWDMGSVTLPWCLRHSCHSLRQGNCHGPISCPEAPKKVFRVIY